jgi:photosystem II stability/assembly factor-like uncharacterized protein
VGRDLTKRYALPSERKGTGNPFLFLRDIHRYGKLPELVSFVVWEAAHKLGLFSQARYLKFNQGEVLALRRDRLNDADFRHRMEQFFESRGLGVVRSPHNWKLLFEDDHGEILGCMYPDDGSLYRSDDEGRSVAFVQRFPAPIKSVFVSSQGAVLVSVKGAVYSGSRDGGALIKTLDLASPESWIRHNNAMAETPDGTLVIGEYGNVWNGNRWKNLAYLYYSADRGATWERSGFLIAQGANKHVHLVKYSRLLDKLFVADGDNKKKLWASASAAPFDPKDLRAVNRFHIQMGGYTSAVESEGRIFFGTDYQGGTNFLVETTDGRRFASQIVPDPYRRSPIENMVHRRSRNGHEIWANLPFSTSNTQSLLMYTADSGQSWTRVLEYNKTYHKVSLPGSSYGIPDAAYFSIADAENRNRAVYKVVDLQ